VWATFVRNSPSIGQLVLATSVVYLYQIDDPILFRIMILATAGFSVSVVLPKTYRLTLFIALSLTGCLIALGIRDGACLIAVGLALIGICRLAAVPLIYRVLGLVAAAGLLAFMRIYWTDSLWSPAVWPLLGSLFMFRMILYVRALHSKQSGHRLQDALAYFFMLPNFAFPLFPVVDYQTFRQTYFDRDELGTYEQGLLWISRGLVHLVLYRFVNQNVLAFDDFATLGDAIRWMVGTLLLYLRVSGQFHLAIGVLHLFGFRLPETHKLYFLAPSFTELWRRMNVYWTTFMTNVIFYPSYFRAKRLGPTAAVAVSTAVVFVATWALHSYQWFWLQGGFPLRLEDVLFWGILGILVVRGAVKEQKTERQPRRPAQHWNWTAGFRAARTFFILCILWSLWSVDSFDTWFYIIGMGFNVDTGSVLLLSAVFLIVVILGAYDWRSVASSDGSFVRIVRNPVFRSTVGLVVLFVLALPVVRGALPQQLSNKLNALLTSKSANFALGYYEQLDNVGAVNDLVAGADCAGKFEKTIYRQRQDYVDYDLYPSLHINSKCWATPTTFSTNSLGMRDREYAVARPPDTFRVELLGPSFAAGYGISDGESFEQLVENRLNREFACPGYRHFEILNFSVPAYSLPHELALLEDRGFRFSPDIVILTVTMKSRGLTAGYLSNLSKKNVTSPYEPVRNLFAEAGLSEWAGGNVPIPFRPLRVAAKHFGIQPKVPDGEAMARGRMVADRVDKWAVQRFAQVTTQHGAKPILLALDDVEDDMTPAKVPRQILRESGLPAIDLLDVYPDKDRHALWASSWDSHPNASGHRLIADRLYKELVPFIRAACGENAALH
jgi:D-alanyl-lipoteichoic acid acyltransferase DltB (MBOAT superfamily)